MDLSPVVLAIPVYFLLIGIELVIQWYSKKELYRLSDAITNINCGIIQQLSGLGFKVLSVGAYVLVFEYLRVFTIPVTIYSSLILFIAADFCYYWAHRISHEINLFWGGHVVHHQSEDYNFSVALRQSSFQVIWTFAFYLPLAVIGFDPYTFLFVSAIVTVYQFWIHTEMIGKLGWLEWIFNTPSHHRVHHGKDPKYIDRNHAGVFIIWDKIFGTFQEEEEKPTYGITKPLNSWNPLWANFDHYAFMWKELKTINGFGNKLKYIFYKPGWLPREMGGYRKATEVDKNVYTKFEPEISKSNAWYVLVQFLVILIVTSLFIFQSGSYNTFEKSTIVLFLILSMVTLGGILESKKWAIIIEYFRMFGLLTIYIAGIFTEWTPGILSHVAIFAWAIISLIAMSLLNKLKI